MRRFLSRIFWRMPDGVVLRMLRYKARVAYHASVTFGHDRDRGLYFGESSAGARIFVADRRRLRKLLAGVEVRPSRLAVEYRLSDELLRPGDLVVDCGAHVGELGLWARELGASYYGFEPDPAARRAMIANMGASACDDRALSNRSGRAELNMATSTGDSTLVSSASVGSEGVIVECVTLDEAMERRGMPNIRVLKVEAEGWEPEVLAGATRTLPNCKYVAVDAGPERAGESTVAEVTNQLYAAGFRMVRANMDRGCFLYESGGS